VGVVFRILVVAASVVSVAVGIASAGSATRLFYLAEHPRQCLIVPTAGKTVVVVPCSDAAHNLEVYAVGHGGWGHAGPPAQAQALAIARSICFSAFQRLTGHAIRTPYGWLASWPDPGAESARYGDKVICGLRTWPHIGPMGSGWHVH
jgi:hypothetical protein